jgi:hypothetical protein
MTYFRKKERERGCVCVCGKTRSIKRREMFQRENMRQSLLSPFLILTAEIRILLCLHE